MEQPPSSRSRLISFLDNTKDNLIDVSRVGPDGKRSRIIPRRKFIIKDKNFNMHDIIIDDVPIVSNNYNSYKLAMDILGPEYHYLADYYLIISDIRGGDREYIKDVAETNYPALVSNINVFDFAIDVLGQDYKYLEGYYELATFIRDDYYEEVLLYLEKFDPRDDDDFAYRIALQYGKQKIY